MINPSYLKNLDEKVKERSETKNFQEGERNYNDLLYSSFSTFDQERNYECARAFRTGWWFPYGTKHRITKPNRKKLILIVNEECQYNNISKSFSNLNGMFDINQKRNQRELVLCMEETVEDCIHTQNGIYTKIIHDWELKNTKTLKLSETKIWLKRNVVQ